ncbi:MAG: MBL fold metallo-hydrolase [Euryarchaeota archaeon]|nr:MBL fold metallo-hydrolase [Euryarchaeota archaeon]MCH1511161.1 MBL fold metallo-hydrolase [Candidatus Thalassarchaeaceae archaeon]MDC0040303.1 MBL fold metallo-hydrolase [Candidatus Poseidoniales archaeon]MDC0184214.1 MBL fold metallo-hydrolase [Candidatus Poseidoniales archaeon]RCH72032.1 MAG: MBL fold metallo-hydrolase [Candidatus Poseidoniales archaeon]|tara:strand:+ start:4514 stop:5323 length:810 start_codon:yes stop_codon:yes gene_type:complete
MGLEITHLGSGSRGNATLLSTGETRVIVDCGFSLKQMEARLAMVGVEGSSVNAIVVSHHHSDHSKSAARASKKWGARLYANLETTMRLGLEPISEVRTFEGLERLHIADDLSLLPVPVPHDDADNVGIIASNGDGRRAAIVTDLGEPTLELMKHLSGCEHISIEANYDLGRLISGPYPPSLKRRISGRGGHLSNEQTADILTEVLHPGLQSVVLCHLSEKNNAPHLAESEVLHQIGERFDGVLSICGQEGPEFSNWLGQSEPERISNTT